MASGLSKLLVNSSKIYHQNYPLTQESDHSSSQILVRPLVTHRDNQSPNQGFKNLFDVLTPNSRKAWRFPRWSLLSSQTGSLVDPFLFFWKRTFIPRAVYEPDSYLLPLLEHTESTSSRKAWDGSFQSPDASGSGRLNRLPDLGESKCYKENDAWW